MKKLFILGLVSVCSAGFALADSSSTIVSPGARDDDSAPVNQSTTVVNDGTNSPFSLDHFYLGYYGNLEGSKLNQLGSPYEVSPTGAMTKSAMTFASDVTGAYMITPDIGVGTYLEMNITPVLGQGFEMLDVGITTFDKKFIYSNGLTVFANAIVEAPVDAYDIGRGMVAGFETTPYFRYELPHSKFTVGAWTEVKDYAGSTSGKVVKTYYNPYIAYQIIPQLSANLGYELEWDHFAGTSGMGVYETDLQPGVLLYLSHSFMLNPYVQFFTNNRITADTACFGASIVARVL